MSVPEYIRRRYSTMFLHQPPFGDGTSSQSDEAKGYCSVPTPETPMLYKEFPFHGFESHRYESAEMLNPSSGSQGSYRRSNEVAFSASWANDRTFSCSSKSEDRLGTNVDRVREPSMQHS